MASSKVVTTNADLPHQSSICPTSANIADHNDLSKTLGSMSMDELLKSIYSSETNPNHDPNFHADGGGASISRQGSLSLPKEMGVKTVDEVWKEIVEGGSDQRRAGAGEDGAGPLEGMSLEDFLTKAGAVREEDVRGLTTVVADPGSYRVDAAIMNGGTQFPMAEQTMEGSSVEVLGNGDGVVVGGAGRGKRRVIEEPVDKASLQKQRRMIKNRESAARSRERKQAYTVELESLVTQLEEENARFLSEEAEMTKQRLKQLMKCIIPVVEMRKPRPVLRRVNSVQW